VKQLETRVLPLHTHGLRRASTQINGNDLPTPF
jgi:hypothetical protein